VRQKIISWMRALFGIKVGFLSGLREEVDQSMEETSQTLTLSAHQVAEIKKQLRSYKTKAAIFIVLLFQLTPPSGDIIPGETVVPDGHGGYRVVESIVGAEALSGEPNYRVYPADIPIVDDTYFPYQYGVKDTGARDVWGWSTGEGIKVAILDSGAGMHDELIYSAKYVVGTTTLNPNDVYGHGTSVGGILAAQGNNGIGIAGMAWDVELISIKVLADNGSGTALGLAHGIDVAADLNVNILRRFWL